MLGGLIYFWNSSWSWFGRPNKLHHWAGHCTVLWKSQAKSSALSTIALQSVLFLYIAGVHTSAEVMEYKAPSCVQDFSGWLPSFCLCLIKKSQWSHDLVNYDVLQKGKKVQYQSKWGKSTCQEHQIETQWCFFPKLLLMFMKKPCMVEITLTEWTDITASQ